MIRLQFIDDKKHPLLDEEAHNKMPGLCYSARHLLQNCSSADSAVIAKGSGGRVIGFARLWTWVHPNYRRRGLALRMWKLLLRRNRTDGNDDVCITTYTRAGRKLAESMERRGWEVIAS